MDAFLHIVARILIPILAFAILGGCLLALVLFVLWEKIRARRFVWRRAGAIARLKIWRKIRQRNGKLATEEQKQPMLLFRLAKQGLIIIENSLGRKQRAGKN